MTEEVHFVTEDIDIDQLKEHPANYKTHPDDQIEHLMASIRANGVYRWILTANDDTILAGHGVVEAAKKLGLTRVPRYKFPFGPDDPRALKILAGDNEISHLADVDDRRLSEILKEIKSVDLDGLLGTGYDERMLANLVYVTRPMDEIQDHNEAAEWLGMPEYAMPTEPENKVVVHFRTEEDRKAFAEFLGIAITAKTKSFWWPADERHDLSSLRFEVGDNR